MSLRNFESHEKRSPLGKWQRRRELDKIRNRRLLLERLEDRSLLAGLTWDGGGANNLWSNALNWNNDVAPASGDNLIFPAGAAQTTNINDMAAGTMFNTIQLSGGGYNISGSAIASGTVAAFCSAVAAPP